MIWIITLILFGAALIYIAFTSKDRNKTEPPAEVKSRIQPFLEELPPLEPYVEMSLDDTLQSHDKLRDIAVIHDFKNYDELISFEEAIKRYYSVDGSYYKWEFPVEKIDFKYCSKGFRIYGDDIYLGMIKKSSREKSDFDIFSRLVEANAIKKIQAEIKDGEYFHLSKSEYEKYAPDDIYNRGCAEWAEGRSPKIFLKVYSDRFGDIGLQEDLGKAFGGDEDEGA